MENIGEEYLESLLKLEKLYLIYNIIKILYRSENRFQLKRKKRDNTL